AIVLGDREASRRSGRARRAAVAPRPAAFLCYAHARPRSRPASRPGAPRPREHLDHPGVYQGVARAVASRVRRRPSTRAHDHRTHPRRWGRRAVTRTRRGNIAPMTETTHANRRAQLTAERQRVNDELSTLGIDRGSYDEGFADSGQVTAERGEVDALVGSLRETLLDIDAALGKLEAGTYGRCESCGQDIAEARLEAMPAARLCMICASKRR